MLLQERDGTHNWNFAEQRCGSELFALGQPKNTRRAAVLPQQQIGHTEYLVGVWYEQIDDFGLVKCVDERRERRAALARSQQRGTEDDAQIWAGHVVGISFVGYALQVVHEQSQRRVVVTRKFQTYVAQAFHHAGAIIRRVFGQSKHTNTNEKNPLPIKNQSINQSKMLEAHSSYLTKSG